MILICFTLYPPFKFPPPPRLSLPLFLAFPNPFFVSFTRIRPPLPLLLQILVILDALDTIDKEATVNFVATLQQPDGSVAGDEWGEIDTRFTYCALNCLALLDRSVPLAPPCVALKSASASRPAVCTELTRSDVFASFFRAKIPTVASAAFRVQRAMR